MGKLSTLGYKTSARAPESIGRVQNGADRSGRLHTPPTTTSSYRGFGSLYNDHVVPPFVGILSTRRPTLVKIYHRNRSVNIHIFWLKSRIEHYLIGSLWHLHSKKAPSERSGILRPASTLRSKANDERAQQTRSLSCLPSKQLRHRRLHD